MSTRKAARKSVTLKRRPSPSKLTPQQENFARHVVMGYSQAEAYRRSYNCDKLTQPSSIWTEAHKTAKLHKVANRINELRQLAAEAAAIDNATMLTEMGFNRTIALDTGKISAAVASSRDRARVAGLLVVAKKPFHLDKPDNQDEAAGLVEAVTVPEARPLNDIARRIAFSLAKGKRIKNANNGDANNVA